MSTSEFFSHRFGKLSEYFFLFLVQISGRLDQNLHKNIPFSMAVEILDPFAFQAEGLAGLCAFRYPEMLRLFECGDLDIRAQSGVSKWDGYFAMILI